MVQGCLSVFGLFVCRCSLSASFPLTRRCGLGWGRLGILPRKIWILLLWQQALAACALIGLGVLTLGGDEGAPIRQGLVETPFLQHLGAPVQRWLDASLLADAGAPVWEGLFGLASLCHPAQLGLVRTQQLQVLETFLPEDPTFEVLGAR